MAWLEFRPQTESDRALSAVADGNAQQEPSAIGQWDQLGLNRQRNHARIFELVIRSAANDPVRPPDASRERQAAVALAVGAVVQDRMTISQ